MKAMSNTDIQDALRRKITRERIGIEVEKSLRGPDPCEALRLIFDLGLYYTVFSDPTINTKGHYNPDIDGWSTIDDFLNEVINADGFLAEILVRDSEERFLTWQLAAVVPYRDAPQPEPAEPGRHRQ